MKLLPALVAATAAKECVYTNWSSWTECSWLCGPSGTKERVRSIRLPRDGKCTDNGAEPETKQIEPCNRKCMNGGKMSNSNSCRCKPTFMGRCCEIPVSGSVDRCDRELRAPDGGNLKCGRAKPEPVNPLLADEPPKLRNGREPLPNKWACTAQCPKNQGMYRAVDDVIQCKHEGWQGTSFAQRSFAFDDYDDLTPTLPLPDCAPRATVLGTTASFALEYEGVQAGVPPGLEAFVEAQCGRKVKGAKAGLEFSATYTINEGALPKRRTRREGEEEAAPVAAADEAANSTEEVAAEDAAYTLERFNINVDFSIKARSAGNLGWASQDMSRSLMRDCVGSVLGDFISKIGQFDNEGGFIASSAQEPEDMAEDFWPRWDLAGSGCLDGSVLVGGNMQEKLECQACPRGTVFVSRARGTMTMCRPCPSGTYMGETGAIMNDAGELGECNACPSDAYMTNVFPAYSKDQCQKTSCFPNRTKFQVVFVLDSSGSVTRPDYIRMREFSKSIVKRMCINGGENQNGKKSCGQAGYVIYNSSPESMLKFKQVETFEDFERIDNYEYRGGAPRIGDVFEFIHDTFVDSEYTKTGIPLNVVLISDGQTQGDDREAMEKWTRILKKRVTKIITISKRSMFNENTLQLATSLEDRYFLYDYHELPGFVHPVMEQLCESVSQHKSDMKRKRN